MQKHSAHKYASGFTLIELLIVIAIIGNPRPSLFNVLANPCNKFTGRFNLRIITLSRLFLFFSADKGGEVRLIKWGYNAGANFKCVVSQKKNTGKTLNDYR